MNVNDLYGIIVPISDDNVTISTSGLKKVACFAGFETQLLGGVLETARNATLVLHTLYLEPRQNQSPGAEEPIDWVDIEGVKYVYSSTQRHNEKMVKVFINNATSVDPETGEEIEVGGIGELEFFETLLSSEVSYFGIIRNGIATHDTRPTEKNKFTWDVDNKNVFWLRR